MKAVAVLFLLVAVVIVGCSHTLLGTSVNRPLVYHHSVEYRSKVFQDRVENLYFALPAVASYYGQAIHGIMAYDMTHSGASANVTGGGLGSSYVHLRMKSHRGEKIHFDVYIYA